MDIKLQLHAEGVDNIGDNVNNTDNTENTENSDGTILGGADNTEQSQSPEGAPEQYDFTPSLPEDAELDEETAREFGEICRKLNLTNEQANKLAAYGYQYAGKGLDAYMAQRDAEINGWGEAAKKELGTEFDSQVNLAAIGLEAVEKSVPGIRQALNETGAGNRIEIIRAMAMLGRLVQEDPGHDGEGNNVVAKTLYDNRDFSKY